jgi:hypothetical protein
LSQCANISQIVAPPDRNALLPTGLQAGRYVAADESGPNARRASQFDPNALFGRLPIQIDADTMTVDASTVRWVERDG